MAQPPRSLHHAIEFLDEDGKVHTVAGVVTQVDQRQMLALGAPVRAHMWLIDEGPGNPRSHHWGSMLAENAIVTLPQRFAIDFIGLNPAGHAVEALPDKLNQTSNNQWIGFGSDVLAVRDAVVRDMRDGVADHAPLASLPEPAEITAL